MREAWFVHGLDIGAPGQPPRLEFYARARRALEPVAASAGVRLVATRTNVRLLDPDGQNWPDAWFGPGTLSLAHAFDGRITDVLLAANLDVEGLAPAGSHPLLDPNFSSAALQVHHEGTHQSRLEKIARVADWPEARAALRVCWQELPDDGPLNCGRCRKCVRAMLGLIAVGRLDAMTTFPRGHLAPEDLEVCHVDPHTVRFYEELLAPLDRVGRRDLATVLRRQLRGWARRGWWAPWRRREAVDAQRLGAQ
ncbi:MAG: hypothetical protein ACT4PV_02285 [Planctomycetaceae bacterium]